MPTISPTHRWGRPCVLAQFLWLAIGCAAPDETPPADVVVRDSGGVRIVELGALRDVNAPIVELDRVFETAREGVELFDVQAARILDDGRLVVGNRGTSEILLIGPDGTLLATIGREGDGPGEFRSITSILVGDRGGFLVYDTRLGRWSAFDSTGTLSTTVPMVPPSRVVDLRPLARSADGAILAVHGEQRRFGRETIQRDTMPLLRFASAGEAPDTLGLWATTEWSYAPTERGTLRTWVGFARSAASAGRGDRVALGDTDTPEVSIFDASGSLRTSIRFGHAREPVAEQDVSAWRAENASRLGPDAPEDIRRRFAQAPYRETYPAFDDVAAGADGSVWIGTAAHFGDDTRRWVAFGADGAAWGRVDLPREAQILDLHADRVVTLARDDMGVESVVVYRVPGRAAAGR